MVASFTARRLSLGSRHKPSELKFDEKTYREDAGVGRAVIKGKSSSRVSQTPPTMAGRIRESSGDERHKKPFKRDSLARRWLWWGSSCTSCFHLSAAPPPEPACASKIQIRQSQDSDHSMLHYFPKWKPRRGY